MYALLVDFNMTSDHVILEASVGDLSTGAVDHYSFFDDNDKNFADNLRRWRECRKDDCDIYGPLIETLKRYKFILPRGREK